MDKNKNVSGSDVIKNLTLLCGFALNLPVFNFTFIVIATEEEVLNHIRNTAQTLDFNGNPMSEEEIEESIQRRIDLFNQTKVNYSEFSYMVKFSRHITRSELSYEYVYDLMSNPPVGQFLQIEGITDLMRCVL